MEITLKEIRHTAHTLSRQYMLSALLNSFLSTWAPIIIERRNDTSMHVRLKWRMLCAICLSLMLHMLTSIVCLVMINITQSFQTVTPLAFINYSIHQDPLSLSLSLSLSLTHTHTHTHTQTHARTIWTPLRLYTLLVRSTFCNYL
jgi:hypothetical protein